MDEIDSVAEIQIRVAKLRRGINRQFQFGIRDAKEWLDWKKLIARHAISSIAVAAALGFAVVPRRQRKDSNIHALSNGHVSHNGHLQPFTRSKPGLAGSLLRGVISEGISVALNRTIRSLSLQAVNSLFSNREMDRCRNVSPERTTKE